MWSSERNQGHKVPTNLESFTVLAYRLLLEKLVRFAGDTLLLRSIQARRPITTALACEAFVSRGGRYVGIVLYRGEYWSAESPGPIGGAQQVYVGARRGLVLQIFAPSGPSEGVYR